MPRHALRLFSSPPAFYSPSYVRLESADYRERRVPFLLFIISTINMPVDNPGRVALAASPPEFARPGSASKRRAMISCSLPLHRFDRGQSEHGGLLSLGVEGT